MINYFEPGLAAAGGAAGAAGGGLLGTLGRFLEPLDYARQAVWNLPGKLAEGDYIGAIPALGGLAAGALMAPFGVPAALGAGALTAALTQGAGRWTNNERFKAPNPNEVMGRAFDLDPDSWTAHGLGMAASMATDPLNLATMGMGGSLGASFGRKAGQQLDKAAWLRGPMYQHTDPNSFLAAMRNQVNASPMQSFQKTRNLAQLDALGQSPELSRVLREIPPDSTFLGAGAEGMVLRSPTGGVTRLSGGPYTHNVRGFERDLANSPSRDAADLIFEKAYPDNVPKALQGYSETRPLPTPMDPIVAQPGREVYTGPYMVQRLPELEFPLEYGKYSPDIARLSPDVREDLVSYMTGNTTSPLTRRAELGGMTALDSHQNNIARQGDRWMFGDTGSVAWNPDPINPAMTDISPRLQEGLLGRLLGLFGSDRRVREVIQQRLQRPQGVTLDDPVLRELLNSQV